MTETTPSWLLLIVSLPSTSATARMRIWRALKAMGCAALRDGAYLLPDGADRHAQLAGLHDGTVREGGSAHLLRVAPDAGQDHYRALYARGADYADFSASINAALQNASSLGAGELRRMVRKQRKDYEAIRAIDFFPDQSSSAADTAWRAFLSATDAMQAGEPRAQPGPMDIARRDAQAYRARTWATRRRPWVDRVASAWLIRRFIDPQAHFLWLDSPRQCPPDALGFDFDGAAFSHIGERVTFEVLLASFGLDADPALARLAGMVHTLDVGGAFVAEASGFEAMLDGARKRLDDDALLSAICAVLDSLYQHFTGAGAATESP